ncbi:non-ribosomal peptide synthetase, partial [Chamaesiphon polymorphus]
ALSRQTGSTLFMTLMAAFATLLYRYSGESDVVIGSPIANRNRSEIEPLIGFFVNTLVLRTKLEAELSFEQLLKQVRANTLTAYEHQDVPFEQIVEALQPQRSMSHSPLFQVMFVLQNTPMSDAELPGVRLSGLNAQSTIAKFDLTLSMSESLMGLECEWEYNTDLFDKSTIERMASHFENLLAAIVANPQQPVSKLSLLSATERQQLLFDWNDTQTDYPKDKCVHQLFEEQVVKTPDAVAVVFNRQELTYRQLNERANQLAHYLQTLGVKPEVLVGICVDRSLEMIVGLLGILKAGGAYVPLDPSYPAERLSYIMADAGIEVLLTQENLLSVLPLDCAQMVCWDRNWETIEQHCQDNPMTDVSADNLAYVIYTSGSTGEPKGVSVAHRGVNRLIVNTNYINLQEQDVVGLASNFSFDAVTFEIWGALVHGAKLVGIERDVMLSPHQLANSLQSQKISTLFVTTALFNQIANVVPSAFNSLQNLMFGGEAVDVSAIKAVLKNQPPQRLLHVYGPTESTTFSTWYLVSDVLEEAKTIPIGRPIANTQVYILDPQLQPVPIGVAGELHIGGDGLARGYLNRPELTQAKFIDNPFASDSSARLYKTGDLARYLPDGNIEFLGRLDHQVKIRGFRIELGEIEAVLSNHPHVLQAVAIATTDPAGNQRLVAYVVNEEETLSTQQLREFLQQQLPAYMVPSTFIVLDTLPLTPNGKVDRKALPAPDGDIERSRKHVAPRTEIEQILANIWQELLLVERVSIHDNFFELGGHSLLAVQLVSQIEKQFSLHLPLATLFQSSTIEQLAISIGTDLATDKLWSPLVPIQPKGSLPPFFCVAGAGGNVMYFHELSQYLGKDRPFYGLQAQGLDGETPPLESVEEIASQYIEAIETVEQVGPYFLGGHSFGGKVAFEMAQQLQRKGQMVYLTILDTTAPVSQPARQDDDRSNWDSAQWISAVASIVEELIGENLAISYEDISDLTPDEQFSYFKQQLEMVGFLPPQTDIKLVRGLLQVYRVQSQTDYVPLNTAPIPITLFRARDIGSEEENSTNLEQENPLDKDPAWGWNQFSDGVVDIHTVPGSHISMLNKPHVQILAQHLQKSLDKAQKHQLETLNAKTTEK